MEVRILITVFTKARHWSQSRDRSFRRAASYRISLGNILILYFHLRLGFSYPSHSSWFDEPTNKWGRLKIITFLLCYFLYPYVTSLLGLDIFLTHIFIKYRSDFTKFRHDVRAVKNIDALILKLFKKLILVPSWRPQSVMTFTVKVSVL
jgi:hypothetical protein